MSFSGVFGGDVSVSGTGFSDIQDAVDGASEYDVIKLGNKSYSGSGDYIKVNKSNIVIEGSSRSSGATLDAKKGSRIMLINATNVTLRFITFTNGDSGGASGGALLFRGTTLIVDNCSFVANDGESGGDIAVGDGYSDVLINNSRFVNNKGSYLGGDGVTEGGAVDSHADFTRVFNCVFIGNSAITHGGALTLRGDNAFVENCSFVNNFAGDGGAVYLSGLIGEGLYIKNCTFTNNYANESSGGAVRVINSFLSFVSCRFVNNRVVFRGGGLYVTSGSLNLTSCTFSGNNASDGGGIYSSVSLRLSNVNFVNNRATGSGGGLYSTNSVSINGSSVFNGNVAVNGGAVYSTGPMVVNFSSFKNNLASSYGGAIYSTNSLTINGGSVTGNNASYGSGVYNTGTLRLNNVGLTSNNAKIIAITLQSPSSVNKGDVLVVESSVSTGDNLLNGVYTKNNNVFKNGVALIPSNYSSGKTITLTANNQVYRVVSSSSGVATFKVPISNDLKVSSSIIKATFSQAGKTLSKSKAVKYDYKTTNKIMERLNNSVKSATKLNKVNKYISKGDKDKLVKNIGKNITNIKNKYKGITADRNKFVKSLTKLNSTANKIKSVSVRSISKAMASKNVTGYTVINKDRTFKEAYDYNGNKMVWFEVSNATNIDQRPAGLRWTTIKQSTTTYKGTYVDYVVPNKTTPYVINGVKYNSSIESFQVKGREHLAKKYLLLNMTTKYIETNVYLENKYLLPSTKCEVNDPYIISLAKNRTANCSASDYYGKANAIYKWVQENVDYVENANYSAMGVLNNSHKNSKGHYIANCVGFSNLISALCRASGIPVKHKSLAWFDGNEFPLKNPHIGHVYNLVYVNGKWVGVDGAVITNRIFSIEDSNNLTYSKPIPNGPFINHDNAWEYFSWACNHYLNSSHNDYNYSIWVDPVSVEVFFKFTNSKINSSKQAYTILKSALENHFLKYPNLNLINSSILLYLENDSNSGQLIKNWLFYCYDTNTKSFSSYYRINENGIAYISLKWNEFPLGTEIYFYNNGTIKYCYADGKNITFYNDTEYVDYDDGLRYIFYPNGTKDISNSGKYWDFTTPNYGYYLFSPGEHLIIIPDGQWIRVYVDGTEEVIYSP
ncbi:MAG: transglutaminase domain-containing protein [Methanobacteriaceae archaeon]